MTLWVDLVYFLIVNGSNWQKALYSKIYQEFTGNLALGRSAAWELTGKGAMGTGP